MKGQIKMTSEEAIYHLISMKYLCDIPKSGSDAIDFVVAFLNNDSSSKERIDTLKSLKLGINDSLDDVEGNEQFKAGVAIARAQILKMIDRRIEALELLKEEQDGRT